MDAAAGNSKRRRGLGIVTPNACTECRKKRAKCDGRTPCGRCVAQKTDCIYEVPVRQSKETMRSEIEALRAEQQRNQRLLAALVSRDQSELVLDQLRNGETVESITDQLDTKSRRSSFSGTHVTTFSQNSDRQAIGNALRPITSAAASPLSARPYSHAHSSASQPPQDEGHTWGSWSGERNSAFQQSEVPGPNDPMNWDHDGASTSHSASTYPLVGTWHHQSTSSSRSDSITRRARIQGQESILGSTYCTSEQLKTPQSNVNQTWTSVTSDRAFVDHLMALYFCWEYPTFASLSKEHFLEDFNTGNPRHCSPLLVNALLALGCRFSNQPQARADPNKSETAGDHFFAEAIGILETQTDRHILTIVQALGLMAIREASCGRSSKSLFYSSQSIRLAVEMGLHLDLQKGKDAETEEELAVRAATFWGAFSLDQAWSISIGRLPHFSRDLNLVAKPSIVDHIEASPWVPYTDDGAPLERSCSQPSNVRSVYKTFCELSEIVHNSLYALYAPGVKVTSQVLLSSYHNYLQWYEVIPSALRLGQNFTPAVLFAHMYYHCAILLLFRPFIKMEIIGSGVSPRDVCTQSADAISALVRSYSQLYTLRRTPSFVPYFVLTSSIAHAVTHGNGAEGPEHLRQGVADLKEMAECHGFAARAIDILRYLLDHWGVDFQVQESDQNVDLSKLCRTNPTSFNQFCPNIDAIDMENGIGPVDEGSSSIFWMFPLQGRPLLDTAKGGRLQSSHLMGRNLDMALPSKSFKTGDRI